jgi:DNA-binding GntR family transcriptional regulator
VGRVTLIGQKAGAATKLEQERLKLTTSDEVLRITRTRYLDKDRISFEMVVLPLSSFPGMSRNEVITSELSELAEQFGIALGLSRERVSTVQAGKAVAGHLHVREGMRLLKLDRTTSATDGTLIEWRVSFSVPSP